MGVNKWDSAARLLWIFPILFLLAGCWDRIEIEERAVILGVAFDVEGKEAEKEEEAVSHLKEGFPAPEIGMIRVTAQIAVPGRIPLGPGEGGGGGANGSGQDTVWVLDAVGHTIEDAVSNLQQKISGPLFFGHLRIIAISEELARKGIQNLNDYFRRNPDVRRMTWLVVTKGKAQHLMETAPELERVPAIYLMSTLDQAVKLGKFPENIIGIFWSHSSMKGRDGILPYLEIKEDENILIGGMALFSGDKMVEISPPLEIAFYMAIKEINPAGYQSFIKVPGDGDQLVVFHVTHRKSKTAVKIENGRPVFKVNYHIECNIREKSNEEFYLREDTLDLIQQEINKSAKEALEKFVQKTQKKMSDIFGFGEYVRAKEPTYWNKEIKTDDVWKDMYSQASIDITVSSSIRRIGMKAR